MDKKVKIFIHSAKFNAGVSPVSHGEHPAEIPILPLREAACLY
jgi:hypothetical protein